MRAEGPVIKAIASVLGWWCLASAIAAVLFVLIVLPRRGR